jgi:hypothetical protein
MASSSTPTLLQENEIKNKAKIERKKLEDYKLKLPAINLKKNKSAPNFEKYLKRYEAN